MVGKEWDELKLGSHCVVKFGGSVMGWGTC